MDFLLYAQWALNRVLNFSAYGYLLYFAAQAIAFTFREWKQIATLATLFIITFCISLTLPVYNMYNPFEWFIKFLVPTSIFVTALCNLVYLVYDTDKIGFRLHVILALLSGFIHGSSFYHRFDTSIILREDTISPILGLTVGVALAQILIISVAFGIARTFLDRMELKRSIYIGILSFLGMGLSIPLLIAAYP